jgi:hypothetical protein
MPGDVVLPASSLHVFAGLVWGRLLCPGGEAQGFPNLIYPGMLARVGSLVLMGGNQGAPRRGR